MGLPVVWHLHESLPPRLGKEHRRALRGVDRFIAISGFVADSARQAGIPDEKLVTIPNPCVIPTVDLAPARRAGRGEYGIDADAPVFGIVGRIVRWKGQKEFLLAAERVLTEVAESIAIIIGDAADLGADYEREIHEMVAASDHKHRILLIGYTADMLTAYAMLDVLVHASIEPEPFGLVITEAMAHRVAVVAADFGAPNEIIEDGVDGFLVDPGNTEHLAKTIIYLLNEKSERGRIVEKAWRKVKKEYDPTRFGAAVAEVYDKILLL
jgi:glycosyltransferase involved in cell wall biosynthesis